jgi:Ca-activated chloride channel homolog
MTAGIVIRRFGVGCVALGLLLCLHPIPMHGQSQAPAAQQMVVLNVRVTDSESHSVSDVPREDFRITEDGQPQTISFFSKEDIPLTYALVVDNSGSIRLQFDKIMATAATIVSNNQPDDETLLIRFISSDKITTVRDFTSDTGAIIKGLQSLYIEGGQSAVLDAVYLAADGVSKHKAAQSPLRRRAMILVTDGEDRASYYNQDQLFRFLGQLDVQIFVIGFVKDLQGKSRPKATALLTRLATDTGGRAFFPSSVGELASIATDITRDIRTQYVIGYVPTSNSTSSFHKVLVSVIERPGAEKRIAVTRVGYSVASK